MTAKKQRGKRSPNKRARKARQPSFDEQIKGARAAYLDFLQTADPEAPELRK
jgi:hypothetical protein